MSVTNNPFRGVRIEFHILQSFPVTCLNRDDVGAPKSAIVGGTPRARVSSQCWKRQVRMQLHELGGRENFGSRTRLVNKLVKNACLQQGATEQQAEQCAHDIEGCYIKVDKRKKKKEEEAEVVDSKNETLIFLSGGELKKIATLLQQHQWSAEAMLAAHAKNGKAPKREKWADALAKVIGKPNLAVDGLDVALFGRMVALAPSMNIEAATSFSHAISTHSVVNEIDFFTALDDEEVAAGVMGSAHMGSLEFNSGTYYRYVSLDLGQLFENLAGTTLNNAVELFTKALFLAIPTARQATQSGACPWEFARVYVRRGQRLQASFETPVKRSGRGFLESSKKELKDFLDAKAAISGSLFGEIEKREIGEDPTYSIDNLIADLQTAVEGVPANAN